MMLSHLTVGHLLVMIALCIPLRCYHFSIWSLVVLDALDAYELLYIALLTRQCIDILALLRCLLSISKNSSLELLVYEVTVDGWGLVWLVLVVMWVAMMLVE